ncbi:MAG: L,D-transpeptidase [Betaproteobacteria bacterium]|nr:L,D-transpeptidase [Betaproteobacteria bacterium]
MSPRQWRAARAAARESEKDIRFIDGFMRVIALRRYLYTLFVTAMLALPMISRAGDRQPWILVDTEALTLTVFSGNNHVLARFPNISIGSGGAAAYHLRGDQTTPRGTFHVSWVDRQSRFGTFYGLDYPSAPVARLAYFEGRISGEEFDAIMNALQHHRTPPQNTPLGGQLGIHGLGGGDPDVQQAVNWTDGCVALGNRQLRRLSNWIHIGTRVVIR